jgi:signal transduction histidine kinase
MLEDQVKERTKEILKKNEEIASQRDNIETQNIMLAKSKEELEQKVNERTVELSHSNQELIRQNVQLEQFAFMTAHNLRAPVARLLGLTSIFDSQNFDDPLNTEVIQRIQSTANGLDEVIRDIAGILEVRKGIHRKFESIVVGPAIHKSLQTLISDINEQNIKVINNVDPALLISGIPAYVHSVFYNIVSNAVKYADHKNEPWIHLESKQSQNKIILTITDNGIGFDYDSHKDKLFKPFARLISYGEGKGLGLYLVKIQMESMNGWIDVKSKLDVGTVVTLIFAEPH